MAIAATSPGTFDSTTTASSYTSGSLTPIAGQPTLILVTWRKATAADAISTFTGTNGWNVTWTQIVGGLVGGSTLSRGMLYRGTPSSGVAGTLTATFGASQLQCSMLPLSFSGVDAASNEGVVQSAINQGTTGGALSATLSAFGHASNATVLFGFARGTPTAFSAESGSWTSTTILGGVNGSVGTWLPSNDTSPTGTLTGGVNWACVGVELRASGIAGHPAIRRLGGIPGASRMRNNQQVRVF